MSSAVNTNSISYDTSHLYGQFKGSMGSTTSIEINDNTVFFKENLINIFNIIETKNLMYCRYLNLRHSSISGLDTTYLLLLEYIDISFSKINFVDFTKNT